MPGSMWCIDNLFIDKAILENATKSIKNLSGPWIDVKKALDSVSHVWLIEVLKMPKINEKLVAFVENMMKSWTITLHVRTSTGNQEIGHLITRRDILQGDTLCVKRFTLCLNPIDWYVRGTEGYNLQSTRRDTIELLRPIYHLLLSVCNMENGDSKAWCKQATPKASMETTELKFSGTRLYM